MNLKKITYQKYNYKYQLSLNVHDAGTKVLDGVLFHVIKLPFLLPKFNHRFFFTILNRNTKDEYECHLYIKNGYAWDGPSGPTLDTKDSMRASLYHDVLWQAIAEKLISERFRQESDKLLRDVFIKDATRIQLLKGKIGPVRKRWIQFRANYWKFFVSSVGTKWVKVFGTKKKIERAPF
jgi:hypothetical protein